MTLQEATLELAACQRAIACPYAKAGMKLEAAADAQHIRSSDMRGCASRGMRSIHLSSKPWCRSFPPLKRALCSAATLCLP